MTLKRFLIIRKQFTKFKSLERSQVRILSLPEGAWRSGVYLLNCQLGVAIAVKHLRQSIRLIVNRRVM